jgi:hypothetical protein
LVYSSPYVPSPLREFFPEGGDTMVSSWWVLAAFIGGGCAGLLVISLMQMAGGLPEPSAHVPDLNGLPW